MQHKRKIVATVPYEEFMSKARELPAELIGYRNGNQVYEINYDNLPLRVNVTNLRVFTRTGLSCVSCGVKGVYFGIYRNMLADNKYIVLLHAIKNDGRVLVMTKDHIVPKCKGGMNRMENYQTMCEDCNRKKGPK